MIDFDIIDEIYGNDFCIAKSAFNPNDLSVAIGRDVALMSAGKLGPELADAILASTLKAREAYGDNFTTDTIIEFALRDGNPFVKKAFQQAICNYGLIQGIATGNRDLINASLKSGANPDAQSTFHEILMTAIVQAALMDDIDTVKLLLEHGADPNKTQNNSESALSLAANHGNRELCRLLLSSGANINHLTYGGTAVALAADFATLKLLLDYGADVNIPDKDGDLPIIGWIDSNEYFAVQALINAGTDLHHRNKNGESALEHIKKSNNWMIKGLANKVADPAAATGPTRNPKWPEAPKRPPKPMISSSELSIAWCDVLRDTIKDLKCYGDYSYYIDNHLKGTAYYDSSYICPYCSVDEDTDGTPIYAVLMKLKPSSLIKSQFETDIIEIFNLFTCCHCHRFYASIKTVNGQPIYDDNFMSPALRQLALTSFPLEYDDWVSIIKESLKFS